MKTYAETMGVAPFDWAAFLARDAESIADGEWSDAIIIARDWARCPCGNLSAHLPRLAENGEPKDAQLANLGANFYLVLSNRNLESARAVFEGIVKLSAIPLCPLTDIQKRYGAGITPSMHRKLDEHERATPERQ